MNKFGAALAALVVGAGLFAAVPATASASAQAPLLSSAVATTVSTDALPTIPDPLELDPVTPPRPLEMPPVEAGTEAAPSDSVTAVGTASISGTLTRFSGEPAAGLPVELYIDLTVSVKFVTRTTTAADGSYAFDALAEGEYYVGFDDRRSAENPSFQWFGETLHTPYGTPLPLADGDTVEASFTLQLTGELSGVVSCSTCTEPLDSDTVRVRIGVQLAGTNRIGIIQTVEPDAEGNFFFNYLYPGSDYYIYAVYSGTGPFNSLSFVNGVTVIAGEELTQNAIVSYRLAAVPGIAKAVNSNVNALYWDYLTRLPTASDVTFWGSQIQAGANPNIIATAFVTSDEYRYIRIDAAYRSILGREPDAGGRLNWLTAMKGGVLTTDDIEKTFYASDEYYQQHGNSNDGFMSAIYQALLHRAGTPSDYEFWGNLVNTQGRAWVIAQFWDSTETISERVSAMYELYLGRVPDAAGLANWVGVALQLGDSGLRAGLSGSAEYSARSQLRFAQG